MAFQRATAQRLVLSRNFAVVSTSVGVDLPLLSEAFRAENEEHFVAFELEPEYGLTRFRRLFADRFQDLPPFFFTGSGSHLRRNSSHSLAKSKGGFGV